MVFLLATLNVIVRHVGQIVQHAFHSGYYHVVNAGKYGEDSLLETDQICICQQKSLQCLSKRHESLHFPWFAPTCKLI